MTHNLRHAISQLNIGDTFKNLLYSECDKIDNQITLHQREIDNLKSQQTFDKGEYYLNDEDRHEAHINSFNAKS